VTSCAQMKGRCESNRDVLARRLPMLVLVAPQGAEGDAGDVSVPDGGGPSIAAFVDGAPTPFNERIPLNPGEHRIMFAYANGDHTEQVVVMREASEMRVSPISCPFHPGVPLGGEPPPPPPIIGGCCGGSHASYAFDARALAGAALAIVATGRRGRKKRPR